MGRKSEIEVAMERLDLKADLVLQVLNDTGRCPVATSRMLANMAKEAVAKYHKEHDGTT